MITAKDWKHLSIVEQTHAGSGSVQDQLSMAMVNQLWIDAGVG